MKFMIASDLHGSAYYTRQLLDCFEREGEHSEQGGRYAVGRENGLTLLTIVGKGDF